MPKTDPNLAREVLEQVARVLDLNHVPKTINEHSLDLSQRVRFLEKVVDQGEV